MEYRWTHCCDILQNKTGVCGFLGNTLSQVVSQLHTTLIPSQSATLSHVATFTCGYDFLMSSVWRRIKLPYSRKSTTWSTLASERQRKRNYTSPLHLASPSIFTLVMKFDLLYYSFLPDLTSCITPPLLLQRCQRYDCSMFFRLTSWRWQR